LRSEEYGEDSRVPEIKIGTPEQDAFRRDLTINSMFYNINLGAIEDFTGKGLIDLREKKANTPLEPLKTFIDDPLRVLRTIRFA
jgi:tRNA nucleotidyltransferase (CCA-adding enzyme)